MSIEELRVKLAQLEKLEPVEVAYREAKAAYRKDKTAENRVVFHETRAALTAVRNEA